MKEKETDNRKIRFSDAPWAKAIQHIVIGGVGGIGSWAAMYLARVGHHLYMYDMDIIDETNMGGQLYGISQIGTNKAVAAKENIHTFCGDDANVTVFEKYNEEEGMITPVVFSCFDNMVARKIMFEKWAAYEKREVFIDGRMLAEVGMVYVVQKGQEDEYRKSLFADDEVKEAPCSFKSTSHCGALIGSLMISGLNNYLANKTAGNMDRFIPFKTDFALPMMYVAGEELAVETASEVAVEKEEELT